MELHNAAKELDYDGDGTITFREFHEWWQTTHPTVLKLKSALVVEEAVIRAVFAKVDSDNSGELDQFEVREMSSIVGIQLSDHELDVAMDEMDADASGYIDEEEFAMVCDSPTRECTTGRGQPPLYHGPRPAPPEPNQYDQKQV